MATFEEIFTEELASLNQEPTDKSNVIQALKDYYDLFHPFIALGNAYLRYGLPFFTQSNTLNQLKNQMYNQIENKLTCGFAIALKPNVELKVRFLVRGSNSEPAIRVQLIKDGSMSSAENTDQEIAARILAK